MDLKNKNGSTLIWVLIIAMVLGLLIAGGLAIATSVSNRSITQQFNQQSYFTAYSVTKSMAEWIQGTEIVKTSGNTDDTSKSTSKSLVNTNKTEQQKFISSLENAPNKTIVEQIDLSSEKMGTCETTFKMDTGNDILISTKAEFNGESSIVSVRLKNNSETEVIPGEGGEAGEWPTFPTITIPNTTSFQSFSPTQLETATEINATGIYSLSDSNTFNKPVLTLTGFIRILSSGSLVFNTDNNIINGDSNYDVAMSVAGTFTMNRSGNQVNGSILVAGGTVTSNNDGIINGNVYIQNSGTVTMNSKSFINGDIYVDSNSTLTINTSETYTGDLHIRDGGTVTVNNQAQIRGNVFIHNGGNLTLNGSSSVSGSIFVQDGGNLTAQTSGSIGKYLVIYNGPNKSHITLYNAVGFSDSDKGTYGIYFLGPLESGDAMPDLSNFNPSTGNYIHVKDLKFITNGMHSWFNGDKFCTGSKDKICNHDVPVLPGSTGSGGSGKGDTTITTKTWSIGSYSSKSITN